MMPREGGVAVIEAMGEELRNRVDRLLRVIAHEEGEGEANEDKRSDSERRRDLDELQNLVTMYFAQQDARKERMKRLRRE